MPISDSAITGRRTAYRCCAAKLAMQHVKERAHGKTKCAEETILKMKFLQMAGDIMDSYPTSAQVMGEVCVSEDLVCATIKLADPGCVVCCGDESVDPPVDPCAIVPDFTVGGVITEDDLPSTPDGNYLVTNFGGSEVSIIGDVVSNALTNIFVVPDGNIVLDSSTSIYYTSFQAVTTLLYPGITVSTVFAPSTVNFISDSAPYAFAQNRPIIIEGTLDGGTTWTTVYSGPEQSIASGLIVDVGNIYDDFRIKYFEGECLRGPVPATSFNNTPPFTTVLYGTNTLFPATNPIRIYEGEVLGPYAQVDASTQAGASGGNFYRIRKCDVIPDYMVAVGQFGIIRKTSDFGQTWSAPGGNWAASPDVPSYANLQFTSLYHANGGPYFVAAGLGGGLFVSADFGDTFNYVPQSALFSNITSAVLADDQTIIIGTQTNGVWKTTNGGTTWVLVLAVGTVSHIDMFGDIVLVFLQAGGCYRSTDQGDTWPAVPNSTPMNVRDSRFDSMGNTVYAVGQGRFKSVNAGQMWSIQEPIDLIARFGLCILTQNIIMFTRQNQLHLSIDGGATSTVISTAVAPIDGGYYAVEAQIMP